MVWRFVVFTGALLLSACVTTIDEGDAFRPQTIPDGATGVRGENEGRLAPFALTHGRIPAAFGAIATTDAARADLDPNAPLFVICMGNAAERWSDAGAYLSDLGRYGAAFTFDYPGYGESDGRPRAADFDAALDAVAAEITRRQAAAPRPLILWGHSLGGFVCGDLTERLERVDGVVYETTAPDAERVARSWTPWFAKPFVRVRIADSLASYSTVRALENVRAPVLIFGGAKDRVLDVDLSRTLADELAAQGANVTYVEFEDGTHFNIARQDGFDAAVTNFLSTIRGLPD